MLLLAVSVPFLISSFWLGIRGVLEITLKVAETHRAERVVNTGIYSIMRHLQHIGGLLTHLDIFHGFGVVFSPSYAVGGGVLNCLIAWKEGVELVRGFCLE